MSPQSSRASRSASADSYALLDKYNNNNHNMNKNIENDNYNEDKKYSMMIILKIALVTIV